MAGADPNEDPASAAWVGVRAHVVHAFDLQKTLFVAGQVENQKPITLVKTVTGGGVFWNFCDTHTPG